MKPELIAEFYDPNRQRADIYDFSSFSVPPVIKKDVRDAFLSLTGHYAARSRRQAWRSVRKLLVFMESVDVSYLLETKKLLLQYGANLARTGVLKKTSGTYYNFAKRVVLWLGEERGANGWGGQIIVFRDFSRENSNSRDNFIDHSLLKRISDCCKSEVAQLKKLLRVREQLENGQWPDSTDLGSADINKLEKLITLEKQGVWTQVELLEAGESKLAHSGIRGLTKYREMTARNVLPIFLQLLIQTGANPMSVMELDIECLLAHPTDESMAILYWKKPRAASEQRLQFLKAGNYSVPNLIMLARQFTAPIRLLAGEADKNILFITRTGRSSVRLSVQNYHDQLKSFRKAHGLPKFTFSDIRKAVASLIYEQEGNKRSVSKFLQHKNLSTTELYLSSVSTRQKRYENIFNFQGRMIEIANAEDIVDLDNDTMFGAVCGAPNGYDQKRQSVRGVCVEFTQCATCVNAVIIFDDPQYVARILNAKSSLENFKNESSQNSADLERFRHAFQPTLSIIENEIIPKVSATVLEKARIIASSMEELPRIY